MKDAKNSASKEPAAILSAECKDTNDIRSALKSLFKDAYKALPNALVNAQDIPDIKPPQRQREINQTAPTRLR